ncbi:MAG TPA: hypothetical protein VFC78_20305 [Tepidisphaeraceae bacterium]|nr:hypothetical protein [Tepidisphaeraceae bacterium]
MLTKTRSGVFGLAIVLLVMALAGHVLRAQVSTEEAQRRLAAKQLAARPPASQPAGELERLRAENRRLRVRVMSLQEEIQTLKAALVQADKAGAATRPAPEAAIAGRWRGGDITTGSGYVIDFAPDGTYKQNFIAYDQRDAGHFKAVGDTLEMWSNKTPEDRKHNQYQIALANGQLTLTPLVVDGAQVKHGRGLVLRKAE